MIFEVLSIANSDSREKYISLIDDLSKKYPHYILDYIEAFCGGSADLIIFHYREDSTRIFLPGLYRNIKIGEELTSYYDFISPYGYSGPLIIGDLVEKHIAKFWSLVDCWYSENKVVSEFIRFNLFGNYVFYTGELRSTLLNIKGKILDEKGNWELFEHKVRKNVRRSLSEKLKTCIYHQNITERQFSEFYGIYIRTMKRTNATSSFFYPENVMKSFIKNNPVTSAICTVYLDEKAISSELVLISFDSIYSFLGGTEEEFFNLRPNDLLKYELINWGRNRGLKYYILGGGYGKEDGIFRYKKSFFPQDVVEYYTGRKIINPEIYKDFIEKSNLIRESMGNPRLDIEDNSYFPLYNKPL